MHINATWQPDKTKETAVKFSAAFNNLSKIEKLDFLQDVMGELNEKYEEIMEKESY